MKAFSLKTNISLLILGLVIVGISIFGVLIYNSMRDAIGQQLGKNAQGTAVFISNQIKNDLKSYKEMKTRDDQNSKYYKSMKSYFYNMKKDTEIRFIYTEKRISNGKIEYILDSEPVDSPESSEIGEVDAMNHLRKRAYKEMTPVYGGITYDSEWGTFITGYAPIIDDSTGEFVGLVGVDIRAESLSELISGVRNIMFVSFFSIICLLGILVVFVSEGLAKRISVDALTDTLNKHQTDDVLRSQLKETNRSKKGFSILLLDIDHFKNINDVHGHEFGDEVLKSTARIIQSNLRASDKIIRYGGEEFIVVLPNTRSGESMTISKRIKEDIQNHKILNEKSREMVGVTMSIGVSVWKEGISYQEMIQQADKAMYISKANNRNTITLFN